MAWMKTGLLLFFLLPGLLIPLGVSGANQGPSNEPPSRGKVYLPGQGERVRPEGWFRTWLENRRRQKVLARVDHDLPLSETPRQRHRTPDSDSRIPHGRTRVDEVPSSQMPFVRNSPASLSMYSRRDRFYGIQRSEVGLGLGASSLFADLTWKPGLANDTDIQEVLAHTGYSFSLFYRYKVNEWFGLSTSVNATWLAPGAEFSNNLYEWEVIRTEWFIPSLDWSPLDVYALAGFSVYFDEHDVMQEPLYFALPVGGGFSVLLGGSVRLGYEASYRFTSNQALDGFLGSPARRDAFLTQSLRLSVPLPNRRIQ